MHEGVAVVLPSFVKYVFKQLVIKSWLERFIFLVLLSFCQQAFDNVCNLRGKERQESVVHPLVSECLVDDLRKSLVNLVLKEGEHVLFDRPNQHFKENKEILRACILYHFEELNYLNIIYLGLYLFFFIEKLSVDDCFCSNDKGSELLTDSQQVK